MILRQRTNAIAHHLSSRGEKCRARLEVPHHSTAPLKVSRQILKDLNAHISWRVQRPKEKSKKKERKERKNESEIYT